MVTNQQVMEAFSKTYSHMTDDQLWGLCVAHDEFLAGAYWALLAELAERKASAGSAPNLGEEEMELSGCFGRR